jgi:hypothetical protein
LYGVNIMDFDFLRNWFSTTTADASDTNSKFDIVEESTLLLSSVNFIHDLKTDDFEFINLPDENEVHSLPYCEVGESVAEIAGFHRGKLLEMCTFSKMTYGNNDTVLSEAEYKTKAEFINEGYSIIPFFYSDGRHAGFVFAKGEEVAIAYRGTKDIYDMMYDSNIMLATSNELLPEGGRIHSGFYNAFKDSWSSLYKILATHASEQEVEIKGLKFNLTGHSMGGSLAKIAALCLNKTENAEDIHIATFGDPRVFDLTASEIYNNALQEKTIRVTQHRQDPVPALAPGSFGYAHVGAQLRVEAPQTHSVHKIDGYYQAINRMEEKDFKSNNDVSLFYYPVRALSQVNRMILGNAQYYANNLSEYVFGRSSFFEKVKEEYKKKECKNASWLEEVKIERIKNDFLYVTKHL